jgi:L-lactate dehydrogenase complex protein LldE
MPRGRPDASVAFLATCLVDTLAPEVGRSTVAVLRRAGVQVEFPAGQTCCGQLHFNSGHVREARALARRLVELFAGYSAIVTPSGSCAAHVRVHVPELTDGVGALAQTWELSQYLVDAIGVTDLGSRFRGTIAYHPTCHSLRLLKIGEAPTRLLRAVAGLELVALPNAEECCGFGGTFAVKNPDVSAAMLAAKLDDVLASGAEAVCACDTSCLLQIGGGLRRRGSTVRALHLAEVLAT